MHPVIAQAIVAERTRDIRAHAADAGRAERVTARNSHATAEASRAACSAERWISPGLFARSTWYIR